MRVKHPLPPLTQQPTSGQGRLNFEVTSFRKIRHTHIPSRNPLEECSAGLRLLPYNTNSHKRRISMP